jgi:hypothetical protein
MKISNIRIFPLTILAISICISSCRPSKDYQEIGLSSFGSINMIKDIGGEIYVLNATESAIYKIKDGRLELFRDIEIGGRDFLLDFDIEGDKVYYSNTYDEIFVSSGGVIEDTVKVINPDRIAVAGSRLFVTSRKAEDGYFYLRSVDIESGEILKQTAMNDEAVTAMKFSQLTISVQHDVLWVVNNLRKRIEIYDTDLNRLNSFSIDPSMEYGEFFVSGKEIKIICSREGKVYVSKPGLTGGATELADTETDARNVDISASCVTDENIYLYNYISGSIHIFR